MYRDGLSLWWTLQGFLENIAGLYGLVDQPETQLRALMGSAMLLGESNEHLKRIAQTPGAVRNLAKVIRNRTDPDCKTLATRIFAALVSYSFQHLLM